MAIDVSKSPRLLPQNWSLPIAFFVDRNYLFPCLVSMFSANKSVCPGVTFYIGTFEGEFSRSDKTIISDMAAWFGREIRQLEISKSELAEFGRLDVSGHFGKAAYGRLALSKKINEAHIYSDSDVLFVSAQRGLLQQPVKDGTMEGFVSQADALRISRLDVDANNREFFSGLIYWPDVDSRRSILPVESARTVFSSHDQAILNINFGQDYEKIDGSFCQLDNPSLRIASVVDGILHYFGNWKPWQIIGRSRKSCLEHDCFWAAWFRSEQEFFSVPDFRAHRLHILFLRFISISKASPALLAVELIAQMPMSSLARRVILTYLTRLYGREIHLSHFDLG